MIRRLWAILTLASICFLAAACAGTQGYDGDPRPPAEVATVIAGFEIIEGSARAAVVSIESIDGATRRGRWKRGTAIVELPPGRYEFVFGVDEGVSPFAPDPTETNGRARRTRLQIASTYVYHVWFDHADRYFFMAVTPAARDQRVVPPPPGSLARCRLALTDADRSLCQTALGRGSQEGE